jgi:hypothetical protein
MSQLDSHKTRIGEHAYEMYPIPPTQSMDLLTDLVSIIAPVIAPVLDAVFSDKKTESVMDKEISPALFSGAFNKLDAKQLKEVRKVVERELRMKTLVDGKKLDPIFEVHFLGELQNHLKWLKWGIEVQWGKSLSALIKDMIDQGALRIPTTGSPSQKG